MYPRNNLSVSWSPSGIRGLTFDQLVGTFDNLTGTIDELAGNTPDEEGLMLVTDTGYVIHEVLTETDDQVGGVETDSAIEIATGFVHAGSPLRRTRILEIQLEYECGETQTLVFEVSIDGGTSWLAFSTVTVNATTAPDILSVRHEASSHQLALRVTSTTLGSLSVYGFWAFIVQDDMRHD